MLTPRLLRDFQKFFLIRRNPLNYNELRGFENGTQTGTRTQDQLVKSQLLYQLSYLRISWVCCHVSLARTGAGAKYVSAIISQDKFDVFRYIFHKTLMEV